MSDQTKIEWCDATFNPWQGCKAKSPACAHCYAEAIVKRFGRDFRKRERTSPENWKAPLKWDRKAAAGLFRQCSKCGKRAEYKRGPSGVLANCGGDDCLFTNEDDSVAVRPRVFSLSMGDWLDDEVPIDWLADFLALILRTPNLDWLLLTKRPENWVRRMSEVAGWVGSLPYEEESSRYPGLWTFLVSNWLDKYLPPNIWIGTTVEDQARADERIPELLQIPARVRFLSCEPLLGPVDLHKNLGGTLWMGGQRGCDGMHHGIGTPECPLHLHHHHDHRCKPGLDWVIAGGESGPKARPMHPDWLRSLRVQCETAEVPFFFKQWGEWLPICEDPPGWQPSPDGDDWHKGKPSTVLQLDGREEFAFPPGAMTCIKIGKKSAGRLLDGREWSEFPKRRP